MIVRCEVIQKNTILQQLKIDMYEEQNKCKWLNAKHKDSVELAIYFKPEKQM